MAKTAGTPRNPASDDERAEGRCRCGGVRFEVVVPAVWAWHDHSPASRQAQGCAYATYVGSWLSRFRILDGEALLTRYRDEPARATRSFCRQCGTPVLYQRDRAPKMVNIPRALFATRTGREPRYHLALADKAEWLYAGEPLVPLKGYPGVMWNRPKPRKARPLPDFD